MCVHSTAVTGLHSCSNVYQALINIWLAWILRWTKVLGVPKEWWCMMIWLRNANCSSHVRAIQACEYVFVLNWHDLVRTWSTPRNLKYNYVYIVYITSCACAGTTNRHEHSSFQGTHAKHTYRVWGHRRPRYTQAWIDSWGAAALWDIHLRQCGVWTDCVSASVSERM